MKKIVFATGFAFSSIFCFAQPFVPGNIVVVRIGSGDAPMVANVAQPVFLDEYTPAGILQRTIAMPVTVNGSNKRLTLPVSTDYSEGYISLSADRQMLALGGYDQEVGADTVATSLSAIVRRVIAVVDANGAVNTSTALNTFNKVVIRSAVVNGNDIWATGASGGVMHTTIGGTTQVLVAPTTGRCLDIFDGQLYATSNSGTLRMTTVGTGLPVTSGQVMTQFNGYPTAGSPYQFFLADLSTTEPGVDVLYTADNNLLRKYSKVSGVWVDNGTIGTAADRYRGLTGRVDGTKVILYAARRNDNATIPIAGGQIVGVSDNTGYNASFASLVPSVIATAPANTVFRGISFVPGTALLPVSLTSFNGRYINNEVELKWITEVESNNAYFNIQRSPDAVSFSNIGRVEAKRDATGKTDYTFNDKEPAAGKNFYRLEQVDLDGGKKLHAIILVSTLKTNASFQLNATPGSNAVEMAFTGSEAVKGTINISDMSGRMIAQRNINLPGGTTRTIIDLPGLSSGIYIARLTTDQGMKLNGRFVK